MAWEIRFAEEFERDFAALAIAVQNELLAQAHVLAQFGPHLGRPRVDTLKGSNHANMKELRFEVAGGVWRLAFAFDPARTAILLVAGNKRGASARRFYERLTKIADRRYARHLARKVRRD